jgi:hypothetical protein
VIRVLLVEPMSLPRDALAAVLSAEDDHRFLAEITSVEPVGLLVGANQRPTGSRGFFGWARFGATTTTDLALGCLPT